MAGHYITYCSKCNKVIEQCRCMDCNKEKRYEICSDCALKGMEVIMAWEWYRRKGMAEMRPYIPGEDLTNISVSKEDIPKEGDMIARNVNNFNDQWLVAEKYFKDNFEGVAYACVGK